ncbi:MAG: hypothetical protein ACYTEW_22260 [Planctomycetota bacterium]|jgi:uncharacterized protein YaaQ
MHKLIIAIIRHERLEKVISALKNENIGFTRLNHSGELCARELITLGAVKNIGA